MQQLILVRVLVTVAIHIGSFGERGTSLYYIGRCACGAMVEAARCCASPPRLEAWVLHGRCAPLQKYSTAQMGSGRYEVCVREVLAGY